MNESKVEEEPPTKEENYVEFWILLFFFGTSHVHWTFLSPRGLPEVQTPKGQPSGLAPGLWGLRRDERENVI